MTLCVQKKMKMKKETEDKNQAYGLENVGNLEKERWRYVKGGRGRQVVSPLHGGE